MSDKKPSNNKVPAELKRQALKQAQQAALEQAKKRGAAYYLPTDGEFGNPFIIAFPRWAL
mgnify:CR=1 FL=1